MHDPTNETQLQRGRGAAFVAVDRQWLSMPYIACRGIVIRRRRRGEKDRVVRPRRPSLARVAYICVFWIV